MRKDPRTEMQREWDKKNPAPVDEGRTPGFILGTFFGIIEKIGISGCLVRLGAIILALLILAQIFKVSITF